VLEERKSKIVPEQLKAIFNAHIYISTWPNYVNSDDAYFQICYSQFQDPTVNVANLAPASKVRVLESLKVIFSRT